MSDPKSRGRVEWASAHAERFTTQAAFLTHLDATDANEMVRNRQGKGGKSDLIGELAVLTSAKLVNDNPCNPKWEGQAACDAAGNFKLKIVIWNEDVMAINATLKTDNWAFIDEMNDTNPTSSPDDMQREFLVGMDADGNYRMESV